MGPNYPIYPSQPYRGGKLPTMEEVGPPDTRYSSGTAPFYQSGIDSMYGRSLAGTGDAVQDEQSQPAWAFNELEMYARDDDVQGSGIFDPPGSHPNIHPDAGIFAEHYSIPGYEARERPFSMSEVRDITTGRPIRAVPSGAVAMDSAAQIAFLERGLFAPPEPILRASQQMYMPSQSIANVFQNALPVAMGETPATAAPAAEANIGQGLLVAALAGGALGALVGWMTRPKRAQ